MRHLHYFSQRISITQQAVAALCSLMIFAAGSIAQAQSGRRLPKSKPVSAAPAPEAKQSPAPVVAKADQARLTLYVSMSERDLYYNIPRYYFDTIRDAFIQRIKEASSLNVRAGREMHGSEAVKLAKAEENTYVVLLELEADSFDPRGPGTNNVDLSRVLVHYLVFAPVTGKVKLEGRTYQRQYRVGRGTVGLPSPGRTNPTYSDYPLKEAAREAADRVLEELNTYRPRDPRF